MSSKRCELCNGKKKIIGLGMIEKDCDECNGVGYVQIKTEVEVKIGKIRAVKDKIIAD